MKIYHYDAVSGELYASEEARLSPRDAEIKAQKIEDGEKDIPDDVYLIPAHATDIAPPEAGKNEKAVFRDGIWSLVPDYRGKPFYKLDETGHLIEPVFLDLGEALGADMALVEVALPDLPGYCIYKDGALTVDQAKKDADAEAQAAETARKARIEELYAKTNPADAALTTADRMFRIGRLDRGLPEV